MDTLTLREAADLCGTTVKAMRNRADRGTIQTVTRDGQRRVPLAELERAGLVPDAELRELRGEVEQLRRELATSRQLVQSTERAAATERESRERMEAELVAHRAHAQAAAEELRALEDALTAAGPIRAWKLARARRRAAGAAHVASEAPSPVLER